MIALVMARSNSERTKHKLIRPFYNRYEPSALKILSLVEIAFKKYLDLPFEVTICGDIKINKIAKEYGFKTIKRSKKSLKGEKFEDVFDFLEDIDDNIIMTLNPCFPLIKVNTIKKIAREYKKNKWLSVITVKEERNTIYHNGGTLNTGEVKGNSKFTKPVLVSAPAIQIFRKDIALKYRFPYRYNIDDPYLYSIGLIESTDINTEDDFKIAQVLYKEFV